MQHMRSDNDTGIRDLVAYTGRDHMTVVEVGSYAGESAAMFLATGKVDKIYCVDPWKPDYDRSDPASRADNLLAAEKEFDARFAGDSRVVKVKSTVQEAIASNSIPAHVDLVYVDGCHAYDCVVADLVSVRGICDILAGHDVWNVLAAVRNVFGQYPDSVFDSLSWAIVNPAGCGSRGTQKRTAYIYVSDDDDRQCRYRALALPALLRSVPSAHIFTLTGGKRRLSRAMLGENILHVDAVFESVYGTGTLDLRAGERKWWPSLVFARLLPTLIPQLSSFQRFVYMDNDTEVVSPYFSLIESIKVGSSGIAGAQETCRDEVPGFCKAIHDRTGIDVSPRDYRSSGVLVMDRAEDPSGWVSLCRRAFQLERKHAFPLADQDAINATFTLGEISDAFNYGCSNPVTIPGGVFLCHYCGPNKREYLSTAITNLPPG